MKISFFLFAAAVSSLPWGCAAIAADSSALGRATALTREGELTDSKLVRELQKLVSESQSIEEKILAADLLIHASAKLLRDRSSYLNLIADSETAREVLGQIEWLRVLRLRADNLFSEGQFLSAQTDFEKLYSLSTGFLRAYALLKLGWCEINRGRSQKAAQLWLQALSEEGSSKIKTSELLTLSRSLGQAIAESFEMEPWPNSATLTTLHLDADQKQAFMEGFIEGLEFLPPTLNLTEALESVQDLPFFKDLLTKSLSRKVSNGERACQNLGFYNAWISNYERIQNPDSIYTLARCAEWVGTPSAAKRYSLIRQNLLAIIPQTDWTPDEDLALYDFLLSANKEKEACRLGIEAVARDNVELALVIPPVRIANGCTDYFNKNEGLNRVDMVDQVLAWSKLGLHRLNNSKDTTVYTFSLMTQDSIFSELAAKALLDSPNAFKGTLIPLILSERLLAQSNPELAFSLFERFYPGEQEGSERWRGILRKRIDTLLSGQGVKEGTRGWEQAAELVRAHFKPADIQEEELRLALAVFASQINQKENQAVKDLDRDGFYAYLDAALDKKAHALVRDGLLLALDSGSWDWISENWSRLQELKTHLASSLAEVQLRWFESLGKEGSPDRPSNLEKAPELFRLSLLYEDLASDEPIFQKEKTGYPSSIAKDVQFLSQLSQSGQITLKKSRSLKPARGMQSWVIYIERNRKTFNKRVWSHPAFEKKARVLLAGFCSDSLGELSEIESKDDVVNSLGPAWTGVRSLLEEKLESCRAGGRT